MYRVNYIKKPCPSNNRNYGSDLEYMVLKHGLESIIWLPQIQKNGVKKFFFMPGLHAKVCFYHLRIDVTPLICEIVHVSINDALVLGDKLNVDWGSKRCN